MKASSGALYVPGSTILHRMDPRAKILVVVVLMIIAVSTTRVDLLLPLALLVMLCLWWLGKLSPARYWRVILITMPLVLILVIIQGVVYDGGPTLQLWKLSLSTQGILIGIGIGLRLIAMGLGFYGFARTTSPADISLALHKAGMPYKGAFLATFAFRFLPLIQTETNTLLMAMASRGNGDSFSKNPIKKGRAILRMIFPLIVGSLKRSGDIALCMEMRGYSSPAQRTFVRQFSIGWRDVALIGGAVSLLALYIVLRVGDIYFVNLGGQV